MFVVMPRFSASHLLAIKPAYIARKVDYKPISRDNTGAENFLLFIVPALMPRSFSER